MKEVTGEEYVAFKKEHNVDSKSLKVTEKFPDGSYSIMYYLGYNRSVKMCCMIYSVSMPKSHSYYIF